MKLVKRINYGGNEVSTKLTFSLKPGEKIRFNIYDFMYAYGKDIKITTQRASKSMWEMTTSWFKELVTGVSVDQFLGQFENTGQADQQVTVAPSLPCDIISVDIKEGQSYLFRPDQLVACTSDIDISTEFNVGLQKLFLGQTILMAKYTAKSEDQKVWVYGFGDIECKNVAAGSELHISKGLYLGSEEACHDNSQASFHFTLAAGFMPTMIIQGPCNVYLQYGNLDHFTKLVEKQVLKSVSSIVRQETLKNVSSMVRQETKSVSSMVTKAST